MFQLIMLSQSYNNLKAIKHVSHQKKHAINQIKKKKKIKILKRDEVFSIYLNKMIFNT